MPRWRPIIASRLATWASLNDDERVRLERLVAWFVADQRWEAAQGFELNEEIKVTIAAHAALLILELDEDCYHNVSSIIVHPSTIVMDRERAGPAPGLAASGPEYLLGEAWFEGPVLIAWDAALDAARHPERGHNVVFHEFAHRLDMLDGLSDGTPPLATREELERWVEVCTAEFRALTEGPDPLIDGYGATNPAEFFAVVTEVFFDRGADLLAAKPDLYEVLRGFYRQDPAARRRRAAGPA